MLALRRILSHRPNTHLLSYPKLYNLAQTLVALLGYWDHNPHQYPLGRTQVLLEQIECLPNAPHQTPKLLLDEFVESTPQASAQDKLPFQNGSARTNSYLSGQTYL